MVTTVVIENEKTNTNQHRKKEGSREEMLPWVVRDILGVLNDREFEIRGGQDPAQNQVNLQISAHNIATRTYSNDSGKSYRH